MADGDLTDIADHNAIVADQAGLDGLDLTGVLPANLNDGPVDDTPEGRIGLMLGVLSQMATNYASADAMISSLVGNLDAGQIHTAHQALISSATGAGSNAAGSGDAWNSIQPALPPAMTSADTAGVAEGDTAVLTLSADGAGGTITFALGGADASLFQISGAALSFQSAPDFEAQPCGADHQCAITVTPSIGANTGSAQAIAVTITDVNDSAPVMTGANSASVAEGETAVLNLTASDADSTGETITFALGGTDVALFQVSGSALSLQNTPDYETPICGDNQCAITVTPSDGVNTGSAQAVTVTITDVNDNAPVMTNANSASVAEGVAAVMTLTASDADADGGTITFALGGADASLFQVSGAALSFQSAPDFEAQPCGSDNECALTVTPSDGVNTGSAQAVTVTITDVNDNAPVMTNADSVSVAEGVATVMTLTASDADGTGETITFALGGADASLFQVSGAALSFQLAPDFEAQPCGSDNECAITVTPSDGVNTGNAQAVAVTITDVNDNAPVMTSADSVSVAEGVAAVLTLTAGDADGTGETITFTLGGTDASLFQISGSALSLQNTPDYETPICGDNQCAITVTPSDGVNTGSAQAIAVTITDLPEFTIADVSHTEGHSGATTAQLTVTLSNYSNPASVDYTVNDDAAIAGKDYSAANGTLDFTGGSTSETISVTVNGDLLIEGDEALTVTLGNPSVNAELGSPSSAALTIVNDDASVALYNDTGITLCGNEANNSSTENCADSADGGGSPIPEGQDGDYGRDAEAQAGSLTKTGAGAAGFDFTRLNADGTDYTGSGVYGSDPWACVRDNYTGLVWEVKTDDGGVHDKDTTYKWGGVGAQQYGSEYYDDWDALVNGANGASLCGFKDWRAPTANELLGLASLDRVNPAIDADYFPNTRTSRFWSTSPYSGDDSMAWYIGFDNGFTYRQSRSTAYYVRLVRSGQ